MKILLLLFILVLFLGCQHDEPDNIIVNVNNYTSEENEQCLDEARRTTLITPEINLNAGAPVLARSGRQLITEGVNIAIARTGLKTETTTILFGAYFALPLANDFSTTDMDFDITLAGQGVNLGAVSISLNAASGVPGSVTTFNDLRLLASVINAQLLSPSGGQTTIDIAAEAVDVGGGNYAITIASITGGLSSTISLHSLSANTTQLGLSGPVPTSVSGIPQVSNQYPSQDISIGNPDDSTATYTTTAGEEASSIASGLSSLDGISASAETSVTVSVFISAVGNLRLTVNGVELVGSTLSAIEIEINSLTTTTLTGVSAFLDVLTSSLTLLHSQGGDIRINIDSPDDGDSLRVAGASDASPVILEADPLNDGVTVGAENATTNEVVVGGSIDIFIDDEYNLLAPQNTALFQPDFATDFTDVVFNYFDPLIRMTYNDSATTTIYDSLGLEHTLQFYFVKQEYDALDPTSLANHWRLYALIDNRNVGDPDTTLLPPANTVATEASYDIFFYDDGNINETASDSILISNWVPVDENNAANGAAGPQNILAGGTIPIASPPSSSNFVIATSEFTQMGSVTTIFDIEQDGYTAESTGSCD